MWSFIAPQRFHQKCEKSVAVATSSAKKRGIAHFAARRNAELGERSGSREANPLGLRLIGLNHFIVVGVQSLIILRSQEYLYSPLKGEELPGGVSPNGS